MKLAFGYNTNGFAHHRVEDALRIIADCGYDGVALTLDVHHANPLLTPRRDWRQWKAALQRHKLRCVIETGARYLLNPHLKHEPTLISDSPEGRSLRQTFLQCAIDIAAELEAESVSFWSGIKPAHVSDAQAWKWLIDGGNQACDYAGEKGVALAFEPEPGMLVETVMDYERLRNQVGPSLALTLDVGHVFCSERRSGASGFAKIWTKYAPQVRNVHIEDIRGRKHEHLMFGEGELDFRKILAPIKAGNYQGLINVELSRDSHRAPEVVRRSIEFLRGVEAKL